MGAWGAGSFENEAAMDWAAGVQSVEDLRKPLERLKRESDAHSGDGELVLAADFACELLAAAEAVAMMLGKPSRDFPEELAGLLADARAPDNLLFHQARNAVLHVMRNSELAGLWQEASLDTLNEWLVVMTGPIGRLNPEVTGDKWIDDWLNPKVERAGEPTDIVGNCAFCDRPIERQHLWGMSVSNVFDDSGLGKKNFWLHLPCLNARMHHKHAVADLKFDSRNPPDLDQL
jgi:hypothetical protein